MALWAMSSIKERHLHSTNLGPYPRLVSLSRLLLVSFSQAAQASGNHGRRLCTRTNSIPLSATQARPASQVTKGETIRSGGQPTGTPIGGFENLCYESGRHDVDVVSETDCLCDLLAPPPYIPSTLWSRLHEYLVFAKQPITTMLVF